MKADAKRQKRQVRRGTAEPPANHILTRSSILRRKEEDE